jgi:DNA-binding MarR family transcriptional regulator
VTATGAEGDGDPARAAWAVMCDLVLDHERRQEVSEAVGLPFSRVRALWRLAASPRTLGELAAVLGIDPPNCTPVVDDLQKRGLAERRPNPADRRSKLVVTTTAGAELARRAQDLWERPPEALQELTPGDLRALAGILSRVRLPATRK